MRVDQPSLMTLSEGTSFHICYMRGRQLDKRVVQIRHHFGNDYNDKGSCWSY